MDGTVTVRTAAQLQQAIAEHGCPRTALRLEEQNDRGGYTVTPSCFQHGDVAFVEGATLGRTAKRQAPD